MGSDLRKHAAKVSRLGYGPGAISKIATTNAASTRHLFITRWFRFCFAGITKFSGSNATQDERGRVIDQRRFQIIVGRLL
jgi:hypothetical protein